MKTALTFSTIPLPPGRDINGWERIPIVESHEPLVSLAEAGFMVECVYYNQSIPGSLPRCLARKGVVERLLMAQALLPSAYRFLIWDAYRPHQVQAFLFARYQKQLQKEFPELGEEALNLKTQMYLTLPSTDPRRPAPHSTGAALDLTLVKEGEPLDMGTSFDCFAAEATTTFFENAITPQDLKVRDNRRLLYHVLAAAGFKNYPNEWWHWSFGDQMACVGTGQAAIYGGIENDGDR